MIAVVEELDDSRPRLDGAMRAYWVSPRACIWCSLNAGRIELDVDCINL
jgi:hypothetical protein